MVIQPVGSILIASKPATGMILSQLQLPSVLIMYNL
jgi:hypothetical protein